ncbi:MAG: hypothetical protein Kow00102_07380 [Spirochaetota bacterium]
MYTKAAMTGAIATHTAINSCIIKIILWFCNRFKILLPAIIPASNPENANVKVYFQTGEYSVSELTYRILSRVNTTRVAIEKNTESNTNRRWVILE